LDIVDDLLRGILWLDEGECVMIGVICFILLYVRFKESCDGDARLNERLPLLKNNIVDDDGLVLVVKCFLNELLLFLRELSMCFGFVIVVRLVVVFFFLVVVLEKKLNFFKMRSLSFSISLSFVIFLKTPF
jgi:Na+/melibiose symporter-like transporter